jgi:hypothetical protein
MSRSAVVLFTRDLRDPDGLVLAAEAHERVLPLCVLEPEILRDVIRAPPASSRRSPIFAGRCAPAAAT